MISTKPLLILLCQYFLPMIPAYWSLIRDQIFWIQNLRVNLEIVDKWFESNLLTINLLKTFSMQFMTKNTAPTKTSI
jgi:hypothetical protein